MANIYQLAQLDADTLASRLKSQSDEEMSNLALSQQKKSIQGKVSRDLQELQRRAMRRARKKSERYGTLSKLASFGLSFIPGVGGLLGSALASSMGDYTVAKTQKKALQSLLKKADMGWQGETFAKEGLADWRGDIESAAKEIDPTKMATQSLAGNLIQGIMMQGLTEGVSDAIKPNEALKTEIADIRKTDPTMSKLKARRMLKDPKSKFGAPTENATIPGTENLLNPQGKLAKSKFQELGGKNFMQSLGDEGFGMEQMALLMQVLTPEKSQFDIGVDPASYLGGRF